MPHSTESPSPWLARFAPLIRPGGRVLDLACGNGRNARWLARQGWQVDAVDKDAAALDSLRGVPGVAVLEYDLETDPWPYAGQRFDGIVVCRYLHRQLLPRLAESLAAGGVLIYETFMQGQELLGRPRNPDFLLLPDELHRVYADILDVIAFEQGRVEQPQPAIMQRICARYTTSSRKPS